jgi:hypothetical protein
MINWFLISYIFRWIATVAELIVLGASLYFLIYDEQTMDLKKNLEDYLIAFSICSGLSFSICLYMDVV